MAISPAARNAPTRLPSAYAAPLIERVLLVVLFVAVLLSSVSFIEPSPHDILMGLLAFVCLLAGVRIERKAVLLFLLLLIWNVSGLLSLMNAPDNSRAIQYTVTSFYLSIAAVVFACLFAQNSMSRLSAMRSAYIASAVLAAIVGIIGYFRVIPGMFELYGRAVGMFKDPNVFGPFLIWPALFVATRALTRGFTVRDLGILVILSAGIFLSFSRGAWAHFALSGAVMFALLLVTAPNPRIRMRLILLALVGLVVVGFLLAVLLSIDSVRDMFALRAQAIQSYDVGEGGRFRLQELAIGALLDFPAGMGPFEFTRLYGIQQHNVYLQGFIVYGWIGGVAYILMVLSTLLIGLRTVLIATPWQPYLLTAFAAFAGELGEGFIIDTDHWRHFYLLLGIMWGLFAATTNYQRQAELHLAVR